MAIASRLSESQDPPLTFGLSDRTLDTRDLLLGNSGLQVITLPVSKPDFPRTEGLKALRRLAWAAAAGQHAVNGSERAQLEFAWLAENRQRYAGRWIALEGNTLLAVGDSAREVYAAIANHVGTPLVTRVEPEDEHYFAGW